MERRTFVLSSTGTLLAGRMLTASPSDRVRVAVLGVNGRGADHINGYSHLPNVEVALLCDPDQNVVAKRAAEFEQRSGHKVRTVNDPRRVFDDKHIDAVSIATPNHWHALATIWACQAGKDVYVEKPGTHNIFEGRKMIEAAAKYRRIVQHGVQLRSSPACQEAVRKLREGVIGKVYMGRAVICRYRNTINHLPDEPVPAGLNYDVWLGPAQTRPFSHRYVHYNWHWQWDFGGGEICNQGVHELDMCIWGLDVGFPRRVSAEGGKFLWDDDKQTPEVMSAQCFYPEQKKMMQIEIRPWYTNREDDISVGNIFYGSDGIMLIRNYDTYETYLGAKREPGPSRKQDGNHYANFIDAVRTRKKETLNAPVETAHVAAGTAHLANISYRMNRRLEFDPMTEKFVSDSEADKLLRRDYRDPFVVPDKV